MEYKTITIFEDYVNVLDSFQEHLHSFNSLEAILTSKNFSLQANGSLQVKHFVGFFQKDGLRLQILPKVYAKSNSKSKPESEVQDSLDFIYRLLYWSGYLQLKNLSPQLQSSSQEDLLEVFITIFIDEFLILFKKKIFRTYETREENQQFIKGKILFSETVRQNPILHHKHVVRFDEFTINTPLNQIFKALLVKLLQVTRNRTTKNKLVIGLTYLQEVELVNISSALFRKIKFDRLNNEFEPLFNLAKQFFHNYQPGISSGSENTFSFLVPLNALFENFIGKVLKSFSTDTITFRYQSPQKKLGHNGIKSVFTLKPDFTVYSKKKCICILDTKYKYPFQDNGNVAIYESDLYQLTTYAARYNCNSLVLIYPKFFGAPNTDELLKEYKLTTAFGKVKLRIIQIDIMEPELSKIEIALKESIKDLIFEFQD